MTNLTNLRRRVGNRTAIVVAGAVGFAIGAGGLVTANHDPGHPGDSPSTSVDDTASTSTVDVTVPGTDSTSIPDDSVPETTIGDTGSTSTSTPDSVPGTTVEDDATSTSVPDDSVPDDSVPDDSVPATSTSVPDDSVPATTIEDDDDDDDDDDATSTSVPDDSVPTASLPDPFTQTFSSAGGSVTVSWSGTAFHLDAISPAPGFSADIEDNDWDRVRVDFEGDDDDHRIEVRLNDGRIRIRVD